MKTQKTVIIGLFLLLLASSAWAGEWVNGVVRRVDSARGKVTIKHEELTELKMPAMTMVFTAKDPSLIKALKRGQKVRFKASDTGGGKLQIEAIEQAGEGQRK